MTEQISITKDNVLQFLRAAVDEKGEDYVDPNAAADMTCQYVVEADERGNLTCGCIIGTAMYLRGVPIEVVAEMDNGGGIKDLEARRLDARVDERVFPSWSGGEDYLPDNVEISPRAADILARAQSVQDNGGTWGEAYDAAKSDLEAL